MHINIIISPPFSDIAVDEMNDQAMDPDPLTGPGTSRTVEGPRRSRRAAQGPPSHVASKPTLASAYAAKPSASTVKPSSASTAKPSASSSSTAKPSSSSTSRKSPSKQGAPKKRTRSDSTYQSSKPGESAIIYNYNYSALLE